MRIEDCTHDLPCDCGSPARVAEAALADALAFIGDQLRRERLARFGRRVEEILPWENLNGPEKAMWVQAARDALASRAAAA